MSICTTPVAAANRYLDQLMNLKADEFQQSLDANVVQHFSRKEGPYPQEAKVRQGAKEVFDAYKIGLFDTTTNIEVAKWAVDSDGLTATCTCVIDQDKDIPNGLKGRFRFKGNCRFDFVQSESGDLKIKEIWDQSEVIRLK